MNIAANAHFWNREAAAYAKKPIADEATYERTLERVREHLAPNHLALEIGCGTGTTALKLAPHAKRIIATDLSTEMIAIAREKATAQGIENVTFDQGTLEAHALERRSFDVIMAFNLLHLVADLPGAIRRIHELLVPGGLFISKTPCVGDAGWLARVFIPMLRAIGRAPFVNFFTRTDLEESFVAAGFSVIETGRYPEKSYNFFLVARKPDGS